MIKLNSAGKKTILVDVVESCDRLGHFIILVVGTILWL